MTFKVHSTVTMLYATSYQCTAVNTAPSSIVSEMIPLDYKPTNHRTVTAVKLISHIFLFILIYQLTRQNTSVAEMTLEVTYSHFQYIIYYCYVSNTILYRFKYIARHKSHKIFIFQLHFNTPGVGDPRNWWEQFDDMFSYFNMIIKQQKDKTILSRQHSVARLKKS